MELMQMTDQGRITQSALELSSLLGQGVHITMEDFTGREATALRILEEEKATLRRDQKTFDPAGEF